jgi:hypothetical protein
MYEHGVNTKGTLKQKIDTLIQVNQIVSVDEEPSVKNV